MSEAEPAARPAEVYGAAAERTELAWQRTAVGVVIGSFVVCHTCVQLNLLWMGGIAALLGMVVAGLFVFAFPTGRHRGGPASDTWSLLLIVICSTTAVGALSLLASVTQLLR